MGQLAYSFNQVAPQRVRALSVVRGGLADAQKGRALPSLPRELLTLAAVLVVLQILDGILTGIGMVEFGTSMEGNILLRSLMTVIGAIPALILVKGSSIALIVYLCSQVSHVKWLKSALYGVVGIYVVFAILPWTYILYDTFMA